MKIGDKVRFLSEVGGGIVTGFQGKDFVLVEDADGFDIPMPIRECVVIETDDYNMKRKPGSSTPKTEGPVKPVKPEMPVTGSTWWRYTECFSGLCARRCESNDDYSFRGLFGE